jgi:hypothetical protein
MERLSSVSGQIRPTSHRVMHRRPTTYSQLKDVARPNDKMKVHLSPCEFWMSSDK